VQILEFCVRICRIASASAKLSRLASASASALPASLIMLKIDWTPELALTNVACAKTVNASETL